MSRLVGCFASSGAEIKLPIPFSFVLVCRGIESQRQQLPAEPHPQLGTLRQ